MGLSKESGGIGWLDLTVGDAEGVRDFYASVTGWTPLPVSMSDYEDFTMMAGDEPAGGVCHARGENADLPPAWLVYINVPDIDSAVAEAENRGGSVIRAPEGEKGTMRFALLRDPAGAAFALVEQPSA